VRSSWDGATWGPWSGDWSFTTATAGTFPGVPTLISPPNQSTVGSLRPTVTWSPVSGATGYALALGDFVFMLTPPLNAFTMGFDLDPSTTYGWSASARNVYGWGTCSNEWTFTTPAAQNMSGASHAARMELVFEGEAPLGMWHTGSE
jgi:hypothetical protein